MCLINEELGGLLFRCKAPIELVLLLLLLYLTGRRILESTTAAVAVFYTTSSSTSVMMSGVVVKAYFIYLFFPRDVDRSEWDLFFFARGCELC